MVRLGQKFSGRLPLGAALLFVMAAAVFGVEITPKTTPKTTPKNMAAPTLEFILETPDQDTSALTVRITLEEGWHVNSATPTDEFAIASELTLKGEGFTWSPLQYPPGKIKRLESLGQDQSLYEGAFEIKTKLFKNSPGQSFQSLAADFFYQACNDAICLRPNTVSASFNQSSSPPGAGQQIQEPPPGAESANQGRGNLKDFSGPRKDEGASQGALSDVFKKNIFVVFLILIGWGLAMNLTPCVYPLIAVTVSLFGANDNKGFSSRFIMALLYVAGIMITFSILGILSALGGQLFGSSLQSPAAQLVISAVFIILALSSFGLYEITLPAGLMGRAATASNTGGYLGGFLAGIFAGVLASPCIGPFILALIVYVAEQGSVFTGFTVFSVFAFGIGLPYIALGVASGLVSKMPRSGNWMIDVKKIMGVILLLLALYYARGFIAPNVYEFMFGALVVFAALYVNPFGSLEGVPRFLSTLVKTLAFVALLYGAHSLWKALGFATGGSQAVSGSGAAQELSWQEFSQEALSGALKDGLPVLIDFESKIWCAACREMEEITFPHPEVRAALQNFLLLKVDVDKHPESEALQNQYKIVGIPTALVIDPRGQEVHRFIGFVKPGEFTSILKQKMASPAGVL